MTTAVELVEKLLAGPIREAAPAAAVSPTPTRSRLRVFGPDSPPKGWFYTGPDPLDEFIRFKRGKDAVIRGPEDRKRYLDFFTQERYTFVFKEGSGLKIISKGELNIPQDGIQALEQTMGLHSNTPVDYNGQNTVASTLIYGQPNRANHPDPDVTQVAEPGKQLVKATFGGIYGDGLVEAGNKVNVRLLKDLLSQGHAFVIRYESGSFNVIMPEQYRFSRQAISTMERRMGLRRNSTVQWFIGSIKPNEAIHTTAAEAIYGESK